MEAEASKRNTDEEAEEESDGENELFVDWSTLFELAVLCPVAFPGSGDGDLERMYARCEQGCCIGGRVFF